MSEKHDFVRETGTAPRVLVVDDETTTCTFCALALKQIGYTAIPITDPEEGVRILVEDGPFDLLLTDIQMPGRSGIELAQIAREHDPAIAVIIMTGYTNVDTLHQSARQGIANFLAKPFEIEELQLAVSQALHKRELLQEQVRLRALERLLHSSEAINSLLDRHALAQVILERARELLPSAAAFIYIASSEGQPDHLTADPPSASLSERGQLLLKQAANLGRPQFDAQPGLAQINGQLLNGGLLVPLHTGGNYLGALLLCEGTTLARPTSADMIALLANQAGPALRNAHLYGELEHTYHELAELDRMKSEFIAIASHELRTPLSLVMGYIRMLRDRGDEQQREFVQRALEGAEKINEIVNDLTRLRNHELQRAAMNRETMIVAELLQQVLERFRYDVEVRGHTVTIEGAHPTLQVEADREMVQVIVGNLLSNAITFSPDGGRISMESMALSHQEVVRATQGAAPNPSFRRIADSTPNDWIVIAITDTGIGILPEQQSKVFERFYQVADSLTRPHGGTGLGLALVVEAVMQHQGIVWIDPQHRHGSRFLVALPAPSAVL